MNVAIFGATGMIGQGALRECLKDSGVQRVVSIARAPSTVSHEKLQTLVHQDFLNFAPLEPELRDIDACLYCLGVASSGMSEADYSRVTYDFTLAAAKALLDSNARMSFVFISGAGADSSERGSSMWARVKGKTENALLAMPFRAVYIFRPAMMHGIESRTPLYRTFYKYFGWLLPAVRRVWPGAVTTTEELGQAMLAAAKCGTEKRIVEASEFASLLQLRPAG